MSVPKAFFDANVLLYMYGGTDLSKQAPAKELFRRYAQSGRILLSTQVVQEFSAGSRKLGMLRPELQEAAAALLDLPLVTVGRAHILTAMRTEERYVISFWDALILAAAESGGAEVLYTEDLSDGQQYGTVLLRDPFRVSEVSSFTL